MYTILDVCSRCKTVAVCRVLGVTAEQSAGAPAPEKTEVQKAVAKVRE